MRFLTWNVNGIRTLTQYHPYCDDLHKNYREILDYLDADVICLQETKITRSKLETDIALVPGYDSYWSFHKTKSGYSGVVVYIKDHIKIVAAEEGISGVLSGNNSIQGEQLSSQTNPSSGKPSSSAASDSSRKAVGGYPSPGGDVAAAYTRYQELDSEGRGIILDLGFFVLFNLYCPNETDETRLPFKMDYYHLLEARVQKLIEEGREVIVMGDMNVIPSELDHCDPAKWKKESGEDDFTNTPPRRWFNNFLAPAGPLTDLFRVYHKDEPGAFTCWNTKINARPSNYGTRLDFILVTSGLLPWFKSCDRKPQVVGSDHCPVVAEMFPEISLEIPENEQEGEKLTQRLQDILDSHGGKAGHLLAAKFYDEFLGKQQKLSAFFKKPIPTGSSPTASVSSKTTPSSTPVTTATIDSKRPASLVTQEDQGPRKKTFFSSLDSSVSQSTPPNKQPVQLSATLGSSTTTSTQPSAVSKVNKSATGRSTQEKGASKKTTGAKDSGQKTVLSFFSAPSKKTSDSEIGEAAQITVSSSQPSGAENAGSQSLPGAQGSPPAASSASTESATSTSTSSTSFSPNDFADWIPGSGDALPFSVNGEDTTTKWQTLFKPRVIPKCRVHGVPCTEYTVNKNGINKGRRFFLCSL
ncbi:Class II abasic (AP) endonuclease [Mortierella sp. GBA43]|nr:Class II abasic (AP) endonuclease [Mortierella sp. GBA43]